MHTISLKVDNSIYSHIMFLLKSLKSENLEIIEEHIEPKSRKADQELVILDKLFASSQNKITLTKELAINTEAMADDIS